VDPGLNTKDTEMQVVPISFDRFNVLADTEAHARIRAARARLGDRAVLLCHHYQRADVYQHADLTGDSLKLARLAPARPKPNTSCSAACTSWPRWRTSCPSPPDQAILPDLAAGCSMADMASLAKVERCWRELAEVLETTRTR
jgi:quinolinate synthase